MTSKAERRAQARAEAAELARQQAASERRRRLVGIGGLLTAVAVLVVVIVVVVNRGGDGPAPAATPGASVTAPAVATADGAITVGADGRAGDPVPSGATVVGIYTDYMCPFCGAFDRSNADTLATLRQQDDVVVQYHLVSILDRFSQGTQYSTRAAAASAAVAQLDPTHWLAFHDALFDHQPDENTSALSDAQIQDVARGAGVADDVVAQITDGRYAPWVASVTQAAATAGISGTPTITIDGTKWDGNWQQPGALQAAVDAAKG